MDKAYLRKPIVKKIAIPQYFPQFYTPNTLKNECSFI